MEVLFGVCKDGSTVRHGTPQFLLRSTVRWYGTPFLQWYRYGTLVQYAFLCNGTDTVPVAYAGFWKGGGQKIWEEQRSEFEIVMLKFRPMFRQNQVNSKNKKKGLHSNFVPFFAQNQVKSKKKGLHSKSADFEPKAWCPTCKGGGACLNFAHFSMQFCNPGDSKGRAMAQWPPP